MDPLGYLQIAKRKWWLIGGLVLAALLIVYVTTPARFVDEYDATHVLLVESGGDSNASEANPEVVALWARDAQVLERAAAAIGTRVNPDRLRRDIDVSTDRQVGTVSITATDRDPDRAVLKANTVAAETVAFLTERATSRQEQTDDQLSTQADDLTARIAELEEAIDENPPDLETLTAERDALIRQLGDVLEAQEATADPPRYTSVQEADRATREERFFGTQNRIQRMALAGLVALVLGFGLAITLDRSDTRLRTRRGAEQHFGLPVIAEVATFPWWSRHRRLVVARRPDSAVAESYRTLRSALMLLGRREGAPAADDAVASNGLRTATSNGEHPPEPEPAPAADVILITSAGSGDGKTTTVANLAAAYGESGLSVLVLSFDLKRIGIAGRGRHKRLPGISDYLAATEPVTLASLVTPTAVGNVDVVGDGGADRPPGGQLAAQRRLLDEARSLADVVILDSAPLLASSLTRELTTMVDSVVVLSRIGRTTVAEAERCGGLLAQLGAPVLGVALVGAAAPASSEYFAYFARPRRRRPVPQSGSPFDGATVTPETEPGEASADELAGQPADDDTPARAATVDHDVDETPSTDDSGPAELADDDDHHAENGHVEPARPADVPADGGP